MAMGDYYCDHEANGAEFVGFTGEKKQKSFPAIGGKVTILLDGEEEATVIPVIKNLFICGATMNKRGEYAHELVGQSFEYLVTNIYKQVFTNEMTLARRMTVRYVEQLAEAAEAKKEYVNTVFGLRYLSWLKNTKKDTKPKYKNTREALEKSFFNPDDE